MLYDIPPRTRRPDRGRDAGPAAEHPRIVAVKDAKGDLGAVAWTLARTDLAYYCGEDMLNLPLLALGAVGVVSVVGHLVGPRLAELIAAVESGDLVKARAINESLLPVYTGDLPHPGRRSWSRPRCASWGCPPGRCARRWSTRPRSRSPNCATTWPPEASSCDSDQPGAVAAAAPRAQGARRPLPAVGCASWRSAGSARSAATWPSSSTTAGC